LNPKKQTTSKVKAQVLREDSPPYHVNGNDAQSVVPQHRERIVEGHFPACAGAIPADF
jgi:hypothetical protein